MPIKTEAKPDIAISNALLSVNKVRKIIADPNNIKTKTFG
jgi:hypothetical protein